MLGASEAITPPVVHSQNESPHTRSQLKTFVMTTHSLPWLPIDRKPRFDPHEHRYWAITPPNLLPQQHYRQVLIKPVIVINMLTSLNETRSRLNGRYFHAETMC
jgi:hypothetical protein